jgi:hypothetical protein
MHAPMHVIRFRMNVCMYGCIYARNFCVYASMPACMHLCMHVTHVCMYMIRMNGPNNMHNV